MSDDPLTPYEVETKHWMKRLFFGGFKGWVRFHRATLARLFNDPRMTEDARQAVREYL